MQFEDLNPKPKIFQAELTKAQYKFLAKLMPSEYVLEVISKPKKEVPPQPKRNPMIVRTPSFLILTFVEQNSRSETSQV